ncbi:MAG: cbb3-type cytochrome c oxidase subunit I [Candidatus Nanopelagicales bacterium]
MSFTTTLLEGNKGAFHPSTQTPMQKLTLRFVIIGLVYYGFAAIEGVIMRIFAVDQISIIGTKQYFGILTAHPLVGIFGSTYMLVFGAFLFLVPFLLKKPLWSVKLANWTCGLIAVGTFTFWFDGFVSHYAPLYTLYWPLPADFTQFNALAGAIFITGIALIMLGTIFFVVNIFATLLYTPEGEPHVPKGRHVPGRDGFHRPEEPVHRANAVARTPTSSRRCLSWPSPVAPSTSRSTPASSCSPAY